MRYDFRKIVSILLLIMIAGSLYMLNESMGASNISQTSSKMDQVSVLDETERIYGGYIEIVGRQIELRIDAIFNELSILRSIQQTYIDHSEALASVTDALKSNSVTADKLTFNGKWYQNSPTEPNVVMVHRHLLNDDGQIKEEVQRDLDNTIFLDLILESFHKNGVKKQLTYTQGGLNKSFTRMYPWVDLGTLFYEVYPAFIDTNIWEAFNPGLVDAFEKRIQEEAGIKVNPDQLARVLLPVQDGVTGEVIMTFTAPLFNRERDTFLGTVAFDVNMTSIIDLVEELNVSKEGFTFLSQSSGNIFAINEAGAEVLGFKEDLDSLEITGDGVGFNRLERMLSQSQYESVRSLALPKDDITHYEMITVEDENYMVITQRLKPFQIWEPEKWFSNESWIVGLVIPQSEIGSEDIPENNKDDMGLLYLLIIGFASLGLFIMSLYKKTSS